MAKGASSQELREHRDVLVRFEHDYRGYVDTQKARDAGHTVSPGVLGATRADLLRRAARADRAVKMSGLSFAITPPPFYGGPVLHDLPVQIFAHETPLYGGSSNAFMAAEMVLDALGAAIGALDDRIQQAEKKEAAPSGRAVAAVRGHVPTLWGRLRHVPRWLGTAADAISVGGVLLAGLKILGVI